MPNRIKIAVADSVAKTGKKPKIACFGLAFKPDIDDLRGSPALDIALSLQSEGYEVLAVEPNIKSYKTLSIVDIREALALADVCALLVKHQQFLTSSVKNQLIDKMCLDFCGALV